MITRRGMLKTTLSGAVSTSMAANLTACGGKVKPGSAEALEQDWLKAARIRNAIVVPSFAPKIFDITAYGAKPGANADCTNAIAAAIAACNKAGGGRVLVPAGSFYTGPVHLKSHVELHVSIGATLKFIPEPKRYLPAVLTRWEGMELMGYSPLIYAHKQKNIAVTGEGTLDGSADNETWWPWKGPHKERHWTLIEGEDQHPIRMQLMDDMKNNVPVEKRVYAEGAYLRPPLFQTYQCKNILVEGVTVKDSPFWLLNPVLSQHITVRGVNLNSHGPNSDGCNPESCDHVLIENCTFNTGDDCIAIKSGRNEDGRRIGIPSQNIVIANCMMKDGHGGVVLGSEISGGVNNVFVENCKMNSPLLERAIRIKTNAARGGLVEHLRIRNVDVGKVQNAVVVNFYYEEGEAGNFDPTVRDIVIENLHCKEVIHKALNLQGFERAPMYDITLKNCSFDKTGEPSVVKNVNNLILQNVTIAGKPVVAKDVMS